MTLKIEKPQMVTRLSYGDHFTGYTNTESLCCTPETNILLNFNYTPVFLKNGEAWPQPVWLSWLEHRPINWKVTGSVAGQGTCLGCGFGPWSACIQQATNQCFSPSLSPSFPHFLKKSIIMSSGKDKKERQAWMRISILKMSVSLKLISNYNTGLIIV